MEESNLNHLIGSIWIVQIVWINEAWKNLTSILMIERFISFWKSVLFIIWWWEGEESRVIANNWHSTVCDFLGTNISQDCLLYTVSTKQIKCLALSYIHLKFPTCSIKSELIRLDINWIRSNLERKYLFFWDWWSLYE